MTWHAAQTCEALSWAHGAQRGQGGQARRDWGVRTASKSIIVGPKAALSLSFCACHTPPHPVIVPSFVPLSPHPVALPVSVLGVFACKGRRLGVMVFTSSHPGLVPWFVALWFIVPGAVVSGVVVSSDSLSLVLLSPCYRPVVLSFHSIRSPISTQREFPFPRFPSYRPRRLV
jgi:hypothetical protein